MTTYPWTAIFLDGTTASQRKQPKLPFGVVGVKLPLLERFILHFPDALDVAVQLTHGRFYRGPDATRTHGWFAGPKFVEQDTYRLRYANSCEAKLVDGTMQQEVTRYIIGYVGEHSEAMVVKQDGSFTWL
jgi:hypothetical protein